MSKRIQHLQELLNSADSNGSIVELDNFIGEVCVLPGIQKVEGKDGKVHYKWAQLHVKGPIGN